MGYNVREDLEHRPFDQQVEIMFLSGPNPGDAAWVAEKLGVGVKQVQESIDRQGLKVPAAPSWMKS